MSTQPESPLEAKIQPTEIDEQQLDKTLGGALSMVQIAGPAGTLGTLARTPAPTVGALRTPSKVGAVGPCD